MGNQEISTDMYHGDSVGGLAVMGHPFSAQQADEFVVLGRVNLEPGMIETGDNQLLALNDHGLDPFIIDHVEKFGIADVGFGKVLLVEQL